LRIVRNPGSRLSISAGNLAANVSPNAAARWFWIVFAVTTAFQVLRLGQDHPMDWLAVDYAMRLAALALLAVSPVRGAVFRREALRMTVPKLLLWLSVAAVVAVLTVLVGRAMWSNLPDLNLGYYPRTMGFLYVFDLTFGLALAATHEELVYRRLARLAFSRLGDGAAMIVTTSLVFALFLVDRAMECSCGSAHRRRAADAVPCRRRVVAGDRLALLPRFLRVLVRYHADSGR
jgi:hypothetical protein